MVIFLILLLVFVTAWGQYWYDRSRRLQETLEYVIEQGEDNEAHR